MDQRHEGKPHPCVTDSSRTSHSASDLATRVRGGVVYVSFQHVTVGSAHPRRTMRHVQAAQSPSSHRPVQAAHT